uniref:Secreted protein n=1 Tax=Opuntia streptacantha TaxID=393608 RepID=A0A7C8ZKH5_OPUST
MLGLRIPLLQLGELLNDLLLLLLLEGVGVGVGVDGIEERRFLRLGGHQQIRPLKIKIKGIILVDQVVGGEIEMEVGGLLGVEIQTPEGGELGGGRAAGEALDGGPVVVAVVRVGVGFPVAVLAEEEVVVGETAHRRRLRRAELADLASQVLLREGVGGVHVLIAHQAQLRAVCSAVHHSLPGVAEIARPAPIRLTILIQTSLFLFQASHSPDTIT